MLADSRAPLVLTQRRLLERLPRNDQRPTTNDQRPPEAEDGGWRIQPSTTVHRSSFIVGRLANPKSKIQNPKSASPCHLF
jgi:hypothetical protein